MRKKWMHVALALLLVCTMAMPGVQAFAAEPEAEDTVIAWDNAPSNWNPHTWTTAADGLMFDYLVTPLVTNIIVGRAYEFTFRAATDVQDITADFEDKEAWGIDEDAEEGFVYQIDLNPDLTWADGTPINADSYIRSMQLLLEPGNGMNRAAGYLNGSLGQNAIRGAMDYYLSYLAGETRYANAIDVEITDDTELFINLSRPCYFFGSYSAQDYYEGGYAEYFLDEEGEDLFEKYFSDDEYVLYTDDMYDDLFTIAINFGDDKNPNAWLEFLVVEDGEYEEFGWETVGLLKTDEYQLIYITVEELDIDDICYSFRRSWLVNEEMYLTGDYNNSVENTASFGPYILTEFGKKGMTMVKNENWYGWEDGSYEPAYEGDELVFSFPYEGEDYAVGFPFEFEALGLYDDVLTAESLGEFPVYFVHLWATWCNPCVAEFGDLAELGRLYGDRVGFIGLALDIEEPAALKAAKKLHTKYEMTWDHIYSETEGLEELREMLTSGYVPTTIIIDAEGNMIGEQIVGSMGLEYYSNALDEALLLITGK